jgi:FkbM family methyltransferase
MVFGIKRTSGKSQPLRRVATGFHSSAQVVSEEFMPRKAGPSWLPASLANPVRTLKKFSYHPRLLAAVRALHLSNILRDGYQWVTGGKKDILKVNVGEFDVLFHVHSAGEYRVLEHFFVSFERDFLDVLLSSLAEGDVFLDVGSSLGEFAVPLAKTVGSSGLVLAVEPETNACAQLEANLRLNGASNFRILRTAMGDECRETPLAWKNGSCPSLVGVSAEDQQAISQSAPSATSGVEVVNVEIGDDVMDREHLPIPAAVKIDVEGFEFKVINGLSRTLGNAACRLVCCEIHPAFLPRGTTSQMVITKVESLGFTDMDLRERGQQIHLIARKCHLKA